MSKTPPQWDDVSPLKKAVDHMLEAANDLSYVRDECDEEDPFGCLCAATIKMLRDRASQLLPPNEGWPNGEGLGKVIPFVPRRTG